MKFLKKTNAGMVLVVILTFILGWQLGHRDVSLKWADYHPVVNVANREPPQNVNLDFKLFWQTWDLLSQKYLDKKALDPQKLYYGAIQGMVAAVGDPYTVFLPPQQQKNTQEELSGRFDGVGIELGFNKDKRLVVMAPLSGTPADKAGIKPQDIIVKIDSKDTSSITLPEAVQLIRGPKGTKVTLTIFREGDQNTRDLSLNRDTIVVKSVEVSFKQTQSGKSVAVIKLSRFGERTEAEWNDAVSQVLAKGVQGVVLDLRNNPGGYLDGAVFIASEFLDGGNVVLQEDGQGQRTAYSVNRQGKLLKLPLSVLINKGSASASEIVAGALQDRKRATLVGEKSFGKGTIQDAEDLPGGSGIHITIAKWLTPNGRWANQTNGFDPDLKVDMPAAQTDNQNPVDSQMDKALDLLNQ